jgi:hypothetical protein
MVIFLKYWNDCLAYWRTARVLRLLQLFIVFYSTHSCESYVTLYFSGFERGVYLIPKGLNSVLVPAIVPHFEKSPC